MSWTSLFILIISTIVIGWLVARFWLQLLIIYYIVQLVLVLLISSGMTTLTWYIMRGIMTGSADTDGWMQVWIYSMVFYVVCLAVYAAILADIFTMVKKLIDKFNL